jgi:hypothetical protein
VPKIETQFFPAIFTVITASQQEQISSSRLNLGHGTPSNCLMRGTEGDAEKDRKITLGAM